MDIEIFVEAGNRDTICLMTCSGPFSLTHPHVGQLFRIHELQRKVVSSTITATDNSRAAPNLFPTVE